MTNTAFKSTLLSTLSARGFIHQVSEPEKLDAALSSGTPRAAYVGFDLTADSLHVGHLLTIMLLRHWQDAGHRPIVLLGGGTTKVGDPSGKDTQRQLLDDAAIATNKAGIERLFRQYLRFDDSPTGAVVVDNADWLLQLNYVEFLRDIGVHFSINRMLTFDSVRLRLEREQPLSFLEFNYMLLQSYDFLELNKRHDCLVQMGGSDQWGNMVSGIDLVRRVQGKETFVVTVPLLTTAGGAKMGKTAGGAVWMSAARLSVFDFWQYWRNADDADVERFLKLFTLLPLSEIEALCAGGGAALNGAKVRLATEVTALAHGRDAALEAEATAARVFAGGGLEGLPVVALTLPAAGLPYFDVLVEAGLAVSKSEARRLLKDGGVRLNDAPVTREETARLMPDDLGGKVEARLSAGKKKHAKLVIQS
ncbi:MAG: tyrosine--tRNA ligase [Alphaproteobacteria bacterium]|jgi:tyrosyl-tRNA synthetase|nr:tyrosine--tRNA ligase [Alphaproteobacteria bacterium]